MKKIFLAALVAVFGFANQVFAQTQLATLFRDGDVKTFYGISALRDAHSNAEHGDVITLSSGTFNSVDITKAITLRGAGMQYDSIAKVEPTILEGTFGIKLPNDSVQGKNTLTMEGIFCYEKVTIQSEVNSPQFVKCKLWCIGDHATYTTTGAGLKNASFVNCYILGTIQIFQNGSATFVNSFVSNPTQMYSGGKNCTFEFQNCVMTFYNSSSFSYDQPMYELNNSIFRNSIILASYNSDYNYLNSSCHAYNCVGYQSYGSTKMFAYQQENTSNLLESSFENIFKTLRSYNITPYMTENLELTDAAKTKYLGADGTQVGIYGGSIPFTARPSNPQITKLNVASKSTADGKLSVDIEVKAAE